MAVALSGIIAAVVGTGAIGAALQTGLAWLVIGASTAFGGALISLGLSYLASSLFRPQQPKPEDVQQSVRQPTHPRLRHYGRVKTSGPWVFAEAKGGYFYKVIVLGSGELDAIEQFWVDERRVGLLPDGSIEPRSRYRQGGDGKPLLNIYYRLGLDSETHYPELSAEFSQWTAAHKGNGVSSLLAIQHPVGQSYYLGIFPNGVNTNYRVVARGSKVRNPVTNAIAWDDNAASVIMDYMSHADGMRLPRSLFDTPDARAGWIKAFNRAASPVEIKAGGTEKRYRLWGSYRLDERPADVLGRMLACCDGRLAPTSDGGITLDIGDWQEPNAIIDASVITGFSELGRGRDIMASANTIRATFLDPKQDYQATDADPWASDADVDARGELSKDIQLNMAPSHSQARRLMKLEWFRANPTWVGTLHCNLKGLIAFGERFIRVQYPQFGINSVFEVQDFRFVLGEGGILQGVSIQVQSMPDTANQWDKEQEGVSPVADETGADDSIPVPPLPDYVINPDNTVELSFEPSSSVLLNYMLRWRQAETTDWTEVGPLKNDVSSYQTPELSAGDDYEMQMSFQTEKGKQGDWSASLIIPVPA